MDEMDVLEASTATEEIDVEDLVTEVHSSPEDPCKFDKSPNTKCSRVSVGQSIKTKVIVSNVRNLDISKMNAQPINPHKKKASGPKKFEDYTYTYSARHPTQMEINYVNPNFASAYD